jgi:hypothetical protein
MNQNLNIRAKPIKVLEENMRVSVHDFGFGCGISGMIPNVQATNENVDKLHFIKIKISSQHGGTHSNSNTREAEAGGFGI